MRTIAGWLSAERVPWRIWALWMALWLRVERIRQRGSHIEPCDNCSDPHPVLQMRLVRERDGAVVFRCEDCIEMTALLREASAGQWQRRKEEC